MNNGLYPRFTIMSTTNLDFWSRQYPSAWLYIASTFNLLDFWKLQPLLWIFLDIFVRLNWPEKNNLNLNFVKAILDKIDKHLYMKAHQLVMDNASIHSSTNIGKYIHPRGYLPLCSLELNLIGQFLSAVKSKVKRSKFLEKRIPND